MGEIREGGSVIRPSTGATVRWTPIEAVADEYDAVKALASRGYRCLGVIGNGAHLRGSGGHTPWCSEGYQGKACKVGKVYAADFHLPDQVKFWPWFRARLKTRYYPWVFYANCNGQQITRIDGFAGTYSSSDQHLHLSGLAGHETDNSSILRDWEAARGRPAQIITQPAASTEVDLSEAYEKRTGPQLDALYDAVVGGKGEAYANSRLRADLGYVLGQIQAGNAADKARDETTLAAIKGLATGQNTTQILTAIEAARVHAEQSAQLAVNAALDRLLGPATGA